MYTCIFCLICVTLIVHRMLPHLMIVESVGWPLCTDVRGECIVNKWHWFRVPASLTSTPPNILCNSLPFVGWFYSFWSVKFHRVCIAHRLLQEASLILLMVCPYLFSVFNMLKQIFPPSGPLATQLRLDCNRFVCFFSVRLFRGLQGSNPN
jgi:hypothetical protein